MGKDFMAAGNVDAFDFGAVEERMSRRNDLLRGGKDADGVEQITDESTSSTPDTQSMRTSYTPDAQDATSTSASCPSPAGKAKRRVNVTLSTDVHDAMKRAAEEYGTSVSALCLEGWLAIKGRYGR